MQNRNERLAQLNFIWASVMKCMRECECECVRASQSTRGARAEYTHTSSHLADKKHLKISKPHNR